MVRKVRDNSPSLSFDGTGTSAVSVSDIRTFGRR